MVFGWLHKETKLRRFRTAYIEVPRKNGKSTGIAPWGLYGFLMDGEAGAEIYSAATHREQAKIVFTAAQRMAKASPDLRARINVFRHNMSIEQTASKFEPLGADADNMDGLNIHMALVDELHAHKTRGTYDVLETGMGSRRQPLLATITTAGFDRFGICYEQRTYLQQILKKVLFDDNYWGIIYTIDEEDDWREESSWIKANPNYGVSVLPSDMHRLAIKAQNIPAAQNNFLCKRLNVWTNQEVRWLDLNEWDRSGAPFDTEELEGRACYGGLDLSTKLDLTAFVLVFPPTENQDWCVISRFWVPEDRIMERVKTDRVPYDAWVRDGHIEATPGNVIDFQYIIDQILVLVGMFGLQEVGYDPWNATQTAIELQSAGIEMVETRQGYKTMSEPSKQLESLVRSGKLSHNGQPVLRWNAANVTVRTDGNENFMPDKKHSMERIDGIVALVMALSRAMVHEAPQIPQSIYNSTALNHG
jgi:phage terminase large subunit-like protein